uniref:Uncharacterized protein n=1 Tax=Knipowitschia caucasica TaxID=637954 RepID=A0AAV2KG89_KNICA
MCVTVLCGCSQWEVDGATLPGQGHCGQAAEDRAQATVEHSSNEGPGGGDETRLLLGHTFNWSNEMQSDRRQVKHRRTEPDKGGRASKHSLKDNVMASV